MESRAHFRQALEALPVDVDGLGAMAQEATVGALTAMLQDDRSTVDGLWPPTTAWTPASAVLADWERDSLSIRLVDRMGDVAMIPLRSARTAWIAEDLAEASELKRRDGVLDDCCRRRRSPAAGRFGAGSLVLHAHAAGRSIERIADHAVTGAPSAPCR
jgi:phosphate uptake regulator